MHGAITEPFFWRGTNFAWSTNLSGINLNSFSWPLRVNTKDGIYNIECTQCNLQGNYTDVIYNLF